MFAFFEIPHFSYMILKMVRNANANAITWQNHLSHAFWGISYYSPYKIRLTNVLFIEDFQMFKVHFNVFKLLVVYSIKSENFFTALSCYKGEKSVHTSFFVENKLDLKQWTEILFLFFIDMNRQDISLMQFHLTFDKSRG